MPRPDRGQRRELAQAQRPQRGKPEQLGGKTDSDIKALVSTLNVFNQKIALIERNEKIIGRNIIVLNKKLKELKEKSSIEALPENVQAVINNMEKSVKEADVKMNDLRETVAQLREAFITREEFQELKYLLDSVNPLEFTTLEQVKELINEKLGKNQEARKKSLS